MDTDTGMPAVYTVPDVLHAASIAKTPDDRQAVYSRAAYLGLAHKLPRTWNPDGSLIGEDSA